MSGTLTVAVARQGRVARLSTVACTHGKYDKPYPERHEHHVWTVALVRRGTFRYRSAATNGSTVMRSGWVLFGAPEAEFECSHDEDGGDECTSFAVAERVLLEVAGASRREKSIRSAPPALPPAPRIAAIMEHARAHGGGDLDEIAYALAEAVVTHLGGTPRAEIAPHAAHRRRVQDALDVIESSCREPLALSGLADAAGLSPYHFLRVFRRVTGTTPHQYLIGARLRLAIQMLLDTDRRVTEIAYDAGFRDLSNFVRTFHRIVGCSPRAYRARGVFAPIDHARVAAAAASAHAVA